MRILSHDCSCSHQQISSAGERRESRRFRLSLAVVFSWCDEHGIIQSAEGWSSNISSGGIYIRTETAPPLGRAVEMNVFLPQPAYNLHAAEIHATGQVTRVEQDPRSEFLGFSVRNRMVLIRESWEQGLETQAENRDSFGADTTQSPAKQDTDLRDC